MDRRARRGVDPSAGDAQRRAGNLTRTRTRRSVSRVPSHSREGAYVSRGGALSCWYTEPYCRELGPMVQAPRPLAMSQRMLLLSLLLSRRARTRDHSPVMRSHRHATPSNCARLRLTGVPPALGSAAVRPVRRWYRVRQRSCFSRGSVGVVMVSTRGNTTCGVRSDGTAWCWGDGTSGQLGNNTMSPTNRPVAVVGGPSLWQSVTVGSGRAAAWGLTARRGAGAAVCLATRPATDRQPGPDWHSHSLDCPVRFGKSQLRSASCSNLDVLGRE